MNARKSKPLTDGRPSRGVASEVLRRIEQAAYKKLSCLRRERATGERNILLHSLPAILDSLQQAIEYPENERAVQVRLNQVFERAGVQAAQAGYSLSDLLLEYRVLSRAITGELRKSSEPSDMETAETPDRILDDAMTHAGEALLRWRAEAARALSEEGKRAQELLGNVISALPVGISIAEAPEGRVLFSNSEMERILGHSLSPHLRFEDYGRFGAAHADGTPYRSDEYPLVRTLRTGERVKDEEMRYRRPDGTETFLLLNATQVKGQSSERSAGLAIAIISDITDRKRIEDSLRENEQILEAFFDSTPGILNILDSELRYVKSDRLTPTYFGLNRRSIVGKPLEKMSPEFARRFSSRMREVMATGTPWLRVEVSGPVPAKKYEKNEPIWLASYFDIRRSDGRHQLGVVGVEITELKRVEEALRKSEERFRSFIDAMPQMAFIAEPDGNIVYHNQRFRDYLGLGDEALGWGWVEHHILHPEDETKAQSRWDEALRTGHAYELESRVRRHDGEYRWHLVRAHPVREEAGRVIRWYGTVTDIQGQKLSEERVREALRARDEFLSVASHELRTPLSSLMGAVQIAARGISRGDPDAYSPDRMRLLVSQVEKQTQRLGRLVDDMLDISRIATGKLTLHTESLELGSIVAEVIERLRPQLIQAGISLSLEIREPAEGKWDRFRLEQVVTNLLTNAAKYGDRKPVRISVQTERDWAVLSVRDHGIGIGRESLERIFNRFERAVTANEFAGLGLGLYISRQIVEAHGGCIWAESDGRGKGATFRVKLPLCGPS